MSLTENLTGLVNLDLEEEVLGVIFKVPNLIKSYYLNDEAFYSPINRHIYYVMKRLDLKGYEIDQVTLLNEATELKEFDGGELYKHIAHLHKTSMSAASIDYKLDKLQELYMKREQVKMAENIIKNVLNTSYEKMDKAINNSLKRINESKPSKKDTHISGYLEELILDMEKTKGNLEGTPTHMRDLDKIMNGMRKQELVIIGANPSTGKTVLATNIAERHALKNKGITAIFSLEMSGMSLSKRMISSLTNIHSDKVKNAAEKFNDKDWTNTMTSIGVISQTKTEIIEETGLTLSDIRRISYKIKDKYKDSNDHMVVLIDYLGLIRKEDPRMQTREHMKEVAVGLKNLAKELDCTVIALSQLSRDNEKDKRKPMMSDLKESGDIEAAADTIILLYREDYQGRETEKKNIIEIIVAKNRNGSTGTAEMTFMKHLSKFIDIG